ncbi:MAG: TRAP transporter small permease subunit [Planctomycetota bacterium]
MGSLLRFSRAVDRLNAAIARSVAVLIGVMVLVGSYNAIARQLERRVGVTLTTGGLLELQWYLFALVFLLGAAHTLRRGEHVRVDVLSGGLPTRGRRWIDCLGSFLLVVPFCVFGVWTSIPFALESFLMRESSSDPGGLPRWPLKIALPVAFALIALQGLADGIRHLAALRGVATGDEGRDD